MPPPTSKAWNYFKSTADSKTEKCKLCETELTYTGGTTNMLNHLRLKHNTGIEHENTPQKQPSTAEFVRLPRSRHLSGTKAEEITRTIVNMIVQDYMPLRIVEGSGFKNLMSLIAPEYSVLSRNTIKAICLLYM